MPLYHTMGIHSLLAMHLVGGCFVPQPGWHAGERCALIERERITSLYLAPTLFHDLRRPRPARGDTTSRRVRALGYAGAAMTSTLVARCAEAFGPRCSSTTTARPRSTRSRSARDQRAQAGLRRPAGGQHAAAARADERRDLPGAAAICDSRRGLRRLLEPAGRRREGDPRRLVPHRRHRPARRGRRPVDRRAGRRHDHLRRREHPPARGRGRARAPPRRARGGGDRRAGRAPGPARRRRRRAATRPPEELDAHCLASPARAASSARASTASWTRCRRARRARSCAELLRDDPEEKRVTEYDGFRVERDAERGVATITLDVPGKFNRVSMLARDQLAALRRARPGRRGALRRADGRRAASSRPAATSRAS